MNVITFDSKLWDRLPSGDIGRDDIRQLVEQATDEAAKLLPSDFRYANIVITPVEPDQTIPETGVAGVTYSDEYTSISLDPNLPYGVQGLRESLRGMVFHELVHAANYADDPWQPSAMFGVVTEGLATVFERNYADSRPLWGQYDDDETMNRWYQELKQLPATEHKDMDYFVQHHDGRRWIVYKVGTWMVDKMLRNDQDLFDIMGWPHQQVIDRFESLP